MVPSATAEARSSALHLLFAFVKLDMLVTCHPVKIKFLFFILSNLIFNTSSSFDNFMSEGKLCPNCGWGLMEWQGKRLVCNTCGHKLKAEHRTLPPSVSVGGGIATATKGKTKTKKKKSTKSKSK